MKRTYLGVVALAAVALTVVFIGSAGAAKPAPTGNCPSSGIKNFVAATNVDASFSISNDVITYSFTADSTGNANTGLPGLVGLCVYTDGTVEAADATPDNWKADFNGGNVSFVRGAGGNKSNLVYSTISQEVGTATFDPNALPDEQHDILLHIADAATCAAVYPGSTAPTCYVLPKPGPICNAGTGNTGALYNAIPTDVGDCAPPSLGFEATGTNEFGDEVTLDPATGTIGSLTVDFQSYACGSGEWQLGESDPCISTPGTTFPVDLTANIYEASAGGVPGALLGTVTLDDYAMPYRPSADETNCPAGGNGTTIENGSQWFNPAFGTCQFSISELVTFDFPKPIDPNTGTVIWTVAFNTETAGYSPTGVDGPYDSLNVGVMSYPNAPYAGTDPSEATVFWSYSGNGGVLGDETDWTGFRPLGAIAAP